MGFVKLGRKLLAESLGFRVMLSYSCIRIDGVILVLAAASAQLPELL